MQTRPNETSNKKHSPDPHLYYFETSLIFLWQFLRFVCFCVAELTELNEFSGEPILATPFIQASLEMSVLQWVCVCVCAQYEKFVE